MSAENTLHDFEQTVAPLLQPVETLLDVQCGPRPHYLMPSRLHVCAENRPEYLHSLENHLIWGAWYGSTNAVLHQFAVDATVPDLPANSVDTVLLLDVLQHAPKDVGRATLQACESIMRRQIIVRVPLSDDSITGEAVERWTPADFDSSWTVYVCQTEPAQTLTSMALEPASRVLWAFKTSATAAGTERLPVKIALVSMVFPPQDSGQAIMLQRLFEDTDPRDYVLISVNDYSAKTYPDVLLKPKVGSRLRGTFHLLGSRQPPRRLSRAVPMRVWKYRQLAAQIQHYADQIVRIVRQEGCGAIVACSGDLLHLTASAWASRRAGVPLVVYMFDYFRHQTLIPSQQKIYRVLERLILQQAAAIIVPNEFLRDEYQRLYHKSATIIHNPLRIDETALNTDLTPRADADERQILYTGQIYAAHYDAFRNLITALDSLNDPRLKLHIYTGLPAQTMEAEGIRGPHVVFHNFQPPERVRVLQQNADILFLPLAFETPYPEIIKTSAPSKLGEYLLSGRPILAHAPKGAFINWYLRQHDCGIVVDEPDATQLAQALKQLLDTPELAARLVENARQRALVDFSLTTARSRLHHLLAAVAQRRLATGPAS